MSNETPIILMRGLFLPAMRTNGIMLTVDRTPVRLRKTLPVTDILVLKSIATTQKAMLVAR